MLYALCLFAERQWATTTAMAKIAKIQNSTPGADLPSVPTKHAAAAADSVAEAMDAGLMPRLCALSAPSLSTELTA